MNTPETKLRECPFCDSSGGVPMLASIRAGGLEWWYVECEDCNARGPELGGPDEAIAAWNTRPTPDAAEQEGLVEELDDQLEAALCAAGWTHSLAHIHEAKRILTSLRHLDTSTPSVSGVGEDEPLVEAAEELVEVTQADLEARLRATKKIVVDFDMIECTTTYEDRLVNPDGPEAADTLASYRKEIERLTGALWDIANAVAYRNGGPTDLETWRSLANACQSHARAALQADTEGEADALLAERMKGGKS